MRERDIYKGTKLMTFRVRQCEHEAFKHIVKENGNTINGVLRKFIRDYVNVCKGIGN